MKKLLLLIMTAIWSTALSVAQEAADPVFPESFDLTLSAPNLEVSQGEDWGSFTIRIEGECAADQLVVTVKIPEGYDGIVTNTLDGLFEVSKAPSKARDYGTYEPAEATWVPVESLTSAGWIEGNVFTFAVKGEELDGSFCLCKDGMADKANEIFIETLVSKKEGGADVEPEFPATFDVTADSETVTVTQEIDEDTDAPLVRVTGTTAKDNVTLTFNLPEGWDGVIGGEYNFGGMKKARADWPSLDDFRDTMSGMLSLTEGKTLSFPADGMPHGGMYFLYSGDQVDIEHGFSIYVEVTKDGEVAPVFPESFDITLSAEGLDMTGKFVEEWGEYTYDVEITGECADDELTVTLAVPEGWDGFLCYTDEGTPNPANAPKKAPTEEPQWISVDTMIGWLGCQKANSVTFPVNGEELNAMFYLYKGDMALCNMGVDFTVTVSKKEGGADADPVFPETFDVKADSETVTIEQEYDEDSECPVITVTGTTTEDNVTLTFNLPEGWDGVIGGEFSFGGMKKARADWPTVEEFTQMIEGLVGEVTKGTELVFPADGMPHMGMYSLYSGDNVDEDHGFMVVVNVEKEGGEPTPEFPESFDITLSAEGLDMTAKFVEEWGEYTYNVEITGETADDELTVTLAVPEGWDGFLCYTDDGTANPANAPKKAPADTDPQWVSVEMMMGWMGCEKANSVTFPVNGDELRAMFYLYKGDMAVGNMGVDLKVTVSAKETFNPDVTFPESFDVTLSAPNLEMIQGEDWGSYTIRIEGECADDELVVTVKVPEGYDGIVTNTLDGLFEVSKAPAKAREFGTYEPVEANWIPVESLTSAGWIEGNVFTFTVKGEELDGSFCLCKDGMADKANEIFIETLVSKKEGGSDPEPVFPERFDITADCETVTIAQEIDEEGYLVITATGTTTEDNVTLTFDLPEDWDGVIGGELMIGGMKKAPAEWPTIDEFRAMMEGMMEDVTVGTQLTFPADSTPHMGMYTLYSGDKVDADHGFIVVVNVSKTGNGIASVEADSSKARYFDLTGAEVVNPKGGIYVKVADGKVSKVVIK